ncbi:MAG: TRAP transporter small permease, partial [Alphaproteobacteria bacterium]|nr:TRAP transporter small permease [Alphaproteobacteria bacterium]
YFAAMGSMTNLLTILRGASRFGLWFGGALILAAAIVIGIDVTIRKLFSVSIGGADELGGYALAIGTAWALGATLLDRTHIRIDSLYIVFPRAARGLLDIVGLASFVAVFGLIAWHGLGVFQQSVQADSRSMSGLETPLMMPQGLWLIGLGLFLLTAGLLLIGALAALLGGDFGAVIDTIGVKTAEEEAEEEIRSAEEVHARETARDRVTP